MNRLAARPTARPTASDNPIVTVLLIAVLHASTAWRSCSRIGRPADQWHPCCPFNSPAARRIKVHHLARHMEEGQEVCSRSNGANDREPALRSAADDLDLDLDHAA